MIESSSTADHLLVDGAPRWDAIDFDVLCSRCGYNLRMLSTPRCPECGLEFEWHAVIDAHFRRNPFLFEHNWRKRPIRSYFVTVWKSLRPRHFWRQLSIHELTHTRPLQFVFASAFLMFFVLLHGSAFVFAQTLSWLNSRALTSAYFSPISDWQMLQMFYDYISTAFLHPLPDFWLVPILIATTLLVMGGLILMLRQTLGRCRIRNAQVLRVIAYAALPTVIAWIAVFHLITIVDALWTISLDAELWFYTVVKAIIILTLFAAAPAYCLAIPLKYYLHLPRPRTLACTAAAVAVLFSFTIDMLVVVGW